MLKRSSLITASCVLVAAFALSGCKSEEELAQERQAMEAQLPAGCKIYDLGEYDSIDQMVAVVCDGTMTTTTNMETSKPKRSTKREVVVMLGQPEFKAEDVR